MVLGIGGTLDNSRIARRGRVARAGENQFGEARAVGHSCTEGTATTQALAGDGELKMLDTVTIVVRSVALVATVTVLAFAFWPGKTITTNELAKPCSVDIELPKKGAKWVPVPVGTQFIEIYVGSTGAIRVAEQKVAVEHLSAHLMSLSSTPDTIVQLDVADDAQHERTVCVMAAIKSAGLNKIALTRKDR